ncbi:sensor histidine kinase [Nonomuraea sp. NPDC049152]|uniref:sensor histidine kinase n=1 Tax=Nonomuraea sp. NPDC049152 TaxID=3154350 RepID=UPI00340DCDF8
MKRATTPWQAITGNPLRFLASSWPWRALAYLLTGLPSVAGVACLSSLGRQAALVVGMIILLVVAGALSNPIAALERRRLRLIDPVEAPAPRPKTPIFLWREIGYGLLWVTILPVVDIIALLLVAVTVFWFVDGFHSWAAGWLPTASLATGLSALVTLVWLAGCAYLFTLMAAAQGALARSLLTAPAEARMIELTRSRARLVDGFEAERRRIERDLHDGTQHQLTAVLMQLGLARLDVGTDPARTAQAIDLAYGHTEAALGELRRVIRGMHPSALTDRGLGVAVADLARHCSVPVTLDLALPYRPPPGVEAAAYFCVSEALTNVIKHSDARQAAISAALSDGVLVIEVSDDGSGGADPAAGSGISGLADRIGVLDGTLSLSSPPGGPTTLRVRIPCD